jgi:membrane protein EpsK
MVPLIAGLFVWVSWISLAVSWSIGRYVTIARENKDVKQENQYFNSALLPTTVLAVVVGMIGVLSMPLANSIVRAPPEAGKAVAFLWACSAVISAMGVLSGALDVGTYCRNRFDIKAMIQVARTIFMVLLVLALFHFYGPRLEWVGVSTIASSALGLGLVILSQRLLLPEVHIRPRMFSRVHFREMLGTNAWILVDQLGTILLLNVDLILVNRFFGPLLSGEYGLALVWVGMLKAVMTAMTVFTPMYVMYVARGDMDGLAAYAVKASRFVGYAMAIPIGLMLGLAQPLTQAWLHRDPGLVAPLIVVLTLPLAFNAAINPLYGVWQALNKVRIPSYATIAAGVFGIVLAIVLVKTLPLGVFGVAIAGGVAFTARNLLFAVWYVSRLLGQGSGRLIRVSAKAAGVAIMLGVIGRLLVAWLHPNGWIAVGLVGFALACIGATWVYLGLLDRSERGQLAALAASRFGIQHAHEPTDAR